MVCLVVATLASPDCHLDCYCTHKVKKCPFPTDMFSDNLWSFEPICCSAWKLNSHHYLTTMYTNVASHQNEECRQPTFSRGAWQGVPSMLLYPLGQLVIWKMLGYLRAAFALLTSACPAFSPCLALSRHHRKTSCPQWMGQSPGSTEWSDILRWGHLDTGFKGHTRLHTVNHQKSDPAGVLGRGAKVQGCSVLLCLGFCWGSLNSGLQRRFSLSDEQWDQFPQCTRGDKHCHGHLDFTGLNERQTLVLALPYGPHSCGWGIGCLGALVCHMAGGFACGKGEGDWLAFRVVCRFWIHAFWSGGASRVCSFPEVRGSISFQRWFHRHPRHRAGESLRLLPALHTGWCSSDCRRDLSAQSVFLQTRAL